MAMDSNQSNGAMEMQCDASNRRRFLTLTSSAAMAGGLAAGYGTLGIMAGRFLYPVADGAVGWQFVVTAEELALGDSLEYVAPTGAKVVIARQGDGASAEDFIALSSVCPHLGCQVHWEVQNDRFFCPCHNGAFDPQGQATEGPPAKAKQNLTRYPIKVDGGLVYVLVPLRAVGAPDEKKAGDADQTQASHFVDPDHAQEVV